MNNLFVKRLLALLLAMLTMLSVAPVTAFATEAEDASMDSASLVEMSEPVETVPETAPEGAALLAASDFVSETHDVFSSTESTIAPGVTQSINYAYAKDGKQMVYYVLTADISRDDVLVQTSYKDQYVDQKFGMEKLTVQMAYADQLYTDETSDRFISEYYKVVGGVNASFYNMTTGQPSGVTYLDGVQIGESASYAQFFAILKDGTAIIDYTKNLSNYEGNIWQACAGSQMLVFDGKDVTATVSGSYNTDRHSRTCVGVTADGKVVMMSLDGRQEPFSCGGTMHELAQIMLEQGCVAAINLDGGGSTTFAARQEGEDDVTIVNRPSDGSERSISSGLIIASLAVPSDVFDRATMTVENEYVTPGSTVEITAKGVSPAGTSAEIPSDVEWKLADDSFGTVENGVFVSNGTVGDAIVQMEYQGEIVGEATIHVVIPEEIEFNSASMTVPYGKSIELTLTATYGLNEVVLKAEDVRFALAEESIGTIDGFSFTAAEEGVEAAASAITAVLVYDEDVTAEAEIKLGKGSEVIYDFEDGTTGGLVFSEPEGTKYNYVCPESDEWVVTAETGKVHSGTYAMAAHVNYSNSQESGYQKTSLLGGEELVYENATRVGMWIYIPDEAVGLWARWTISGATGVDDNGDYVWTGITGQVTDTTAGGTGVVSSFDESGWHYLSIDTSAYQAVKLTTGAIMQFYVSDRDGSAYGYDASDYSNITGNFTFYMDDITVDYSEAVDDREAPVFSSVVYADEFTNDAPELKGQTTTSNTLSFTATVADYVKSNASGLNASTAKAYIDGVEVPFTYTSGKMAIEDAVLADGLHTIKFSICDNMGNYGYVIRQINVNAESGLETVKLVAHDASLDRILHGSVFYMDLVATKAENVQSVSVSIDLDSLSTWELEHMEVTKGFKAAYSVQEDENIATITVTRTGDVEVSGEAALVSIPVRVWQLKTGYVYANGTKAGSQAYTAKQFRDMKEFWRISLIATVDKGVLTTVEGTSTFTGTQVFVDTESWAEDADMIATSDGLEYYNNWDGGHVHTAEALEDKDATCTEDGYTGRTFCEGCNSVVEWGTTIPATGHSYEVVDGVLKCECGETFNGTWTDGKTYVDGVVAVDGWAGNSYYVDGVKLTGIQKVTAPDGSGEFYYDFGEDGVCQNQTKYTGFIIDETGIRYSQIGVLATGWMYINGDYYYFYGNGYAETESLVYYASTPYYFDETGKLISGFWHNDGVGMKYYYGPSYYCHEWAEIDGNTYYFDSDGHRLEGWNWIIESGTNPPQWYEFDEEGALVQKYTGTGLFEANGELYYTENGISKIGLILAEDGYYYYFKSSTFAAVKNCTYWVSRPNDTGIPAGSYEFDEQGRMVIEIEEVKDGIVEEDGVLYYYEDGVKTYAGLIIIDGDYYYVNSSCKVVTTAHYWVNKTNDLLPAGYYDFGSDGKMIVEEEAEPKNGIVEEDGVLYYYEDGVKTYAGLIIIDGDYYYVNSSCKVVTTTHYWVYKTNDLLPAGYYDFGADGKMIVEEEAEPKNGIVEEDGTLYYYVDGVKTYAGLIIIDGDYYYVNSSCKVVTTTHYWVNKTNDLLPAGFYDFAEDGKMIR